ncbi:MAG: hypothetical protein ABSG53_29145 [Thermoguttaceae bacterium]|jgi:hypothetical protein
MNMFGRKVSLGFGLLAVAAFLLSAAVPAPALAANPVPSLDVVPADAAFYSVMLRNREQFDAVVNSKAFAKLKALPHVQMGLGLYQMQAADPNSPVGKFEAARRDPELKKSLDFLADLFSDEVFVFGGPSFSQTVELFQGTFGDYNSANFLDGFNRGFERARGGGVPRAQAEDAYARAFLRALVKRIDLIKFPELVIGFKVKDKALAKEQLDHLQTSLQMVLAQAPPLKNRLKRATVGGQSYLTFTLDGSMVPWDPAVVEKIRSLATTPADGDKLIEHLKKTTLVVSLGLCNDYLLLAIGPSTDVLAKVGNGTPLRSLPELAAVAKFADKRICAVGYLSKTLNERCSQTQSGIDEMLKTVKNFLPSLPVPDKLREQIAKDSADLAADLKTFIPEVGAASSVSFLTNSGMESYGYDWSEHPELDSSKPLDLLKHIGGNPIAVLVGRSKVSPAGYNLLVKWIGIGYRYAEEYGLPQMKPKDRAEFDKVFAQVKPLLVRLDNATRNLLIPALADGQTGLVIDAKFTSHQFIKALPPTEQSLTMLEPAIVLGVSNAAKLKQAFVEYYAVADDFVEVLKGIEKSEIPKNFKIPRPRVYKLSLGTAYGYPLPVAFGVDSRVLPNAALSEKVAVLSLNGKHTLRLLEEKEPKIAGLTLPTNRPLAAVGGLDFAAFIDALTPWVELALEKGTAQLSPQEGESARQTAKTVLEVLKVCRGSISITYVDGKATVTRSRTVFHDLDE